MTKAFVLDWHIPVDKPLLEGDTFDRWSEEEVEEGCRFKVDHDGFFISWKSEGREAEVLDLSQVNRSIHHYNSFKISDRAPGSDFLLVIYLLAHFNIPTQISVEIAPHGAQ